MLYNIFRRQFCRTNDRGGAVVKKKKKGNIMSKAVIFSLICVLAFVFYTKYTALKDYRNEIDNLKGQIAQQREIGRELDKTAREYSTDEYVEKYARILGLVKPNEKIFKNYN